ncbi:MAG: dockerin type I repeat-containing protein [Candidatus Omnitrophota bacterium]
MCKEKYIILFSCLFFVAFLTGKVNNINAQQGGSEFLPLSEPIIEQLSDDFAVYDQQILAYGIQNAEFFSDNNKVRMRLTTQNNNTGNLPATTDSFLETTVYLRNPKNVQTLPVCGDGHCDITESFDNCLLDCPLIPGCGDANNDTFVDTADCTFLLQYIFADGTAPTYYEVADVDASGSVDIEDVNYLLDYLYASGPRPTCLPLCGNNVCNDFDEQGETKCTCPEDCPGWCSNEEMEAATDLEPSDDAS